MGGRSPRRPARGARLDLDRTLSGSILVLNAGSSTLKYALFDATGSPRRGHPRRLVEGDPAGAVGAVLDEVAERGPPLVAVGHRLVHGGPDLGEPVVVDAGIRAELERAVELAPLHLPGALAVLDAAEARTGVAQVACFDTAFHRRRPEAAQRLALPEDLWRQGVRRYGFHGLSYEYVVDVAAAAPGRAVVAHLGSGSSLAAVLDGVGVDTTMGLTPTGGVVMGTRPGDLDPGVVVWMLRHGWDVDGLEDLLNHAAGLRGLSGTSADMRVLLENRASDPAAALAVEVFCREVRARIGAYAATLGGLDTIVFTGGIGERSSEIRAEVCEGLDFLGIALDPAANAAGAGDIAASGAAVAVRVVATDEEAVIAGHTARLVGA